MPYNVSFLPIRRVRLAIRLGWLCVAIGALGVIPSLFTLPPHLLWLEDVGGFVVVLAVFVGFVIGIYAIATTGRPRVID